jgi:cell division protein FtsI/penicillin-binding protein 2
MSAQERGREALLRKGSLSAGDVALLLRDHALRLRVPRDTVRFGDRSAAIDYAVDTALQHYADILLDRYHPEYGAVVAMDPVSGRVLAATSYTNAEDGPRGSRLFLRSLFPAASIFKIVTAAGAIEMGGYTRESTVRQVGRNHTLYKYQLEEEPTQFREIPFVEAFAYSVNSAFGRLGIFVLGERGLRTYGERFELDADSAQLSIVDSAYCLAEIASGFNQQTRMSPLFGALLASAVSERGVMPCPWLVREVRTVPNRAVIYAAQPKAWRRAVSPKTAEELKQMMMSVTRFGTARRSFNIVKRSSMFRDVEYGGKTGNVDCDGMGRADWFVGFARHPREATKRIAVGVVTVHGPYWTVHSSYVGAALFRKYFSILGRDKNNGKATGIASRGHVGGKAEGG